MRRRSRRRVQFDYTDRYYKPRGIPLNRLEEINLSHEEMETLRLKYENNLTQHEAAQKMGISQSQYQRDISKALEKITKALIEGKAIRIEENRQLQ